MRIYITNRINRINKLLVLNYEGKFNSDNQLLEYEIGCRNNKYDSELKLYCIFAKKDKKARNNEMDEESGNATDIDYHVTYLHYFKIVRVHENPKPPNQNI